MIYTILLILLIAAPPPFFKEPTCESWTDLDWKVCRNRCRDLDAEEMVCLDGYCFCCVGGVCFPEESDPGC